MSSLIQNLRSYRFEGVALLDVLATIAGAVTWSRRMGHSLLASIIGFFILGHLTHLATGTTTQFSKPVDTEEKDESLILLN